MTQVRRYPFSTPARIEVDPTYARLRRSEPLSRVRLPYGGEAWLATRYEDVRKVLADPVFSRAMTVGRDVPRSFPHSPGEGMPMMDPPDHTRLRRLVARAFTARRIEALRPRTQQIADELLGRMVQAGPPADLMENFAVPLPITVICELFGVPVADHDLFRLWSDAFVSTTALSMPEIQQRIADITAYVAEMIAKRRAQPTDDLLGVLVQARDEDNDRLSEDELVGLATLVLAAGHETTVSHIGNLMFALLTHPSRLAQLLGYPGLIPAAVEELMRFVPLEANAMFARYASRDIEVGGVVVRAGEAVLGSLASANRDETVFPSPDVLDFGRSPNSHIGFGHGPHHCLGAPLARMQLQVAIGSILRGLPGITLADGEQGMRWKTGMLLRGPVTMPVAWA